jgi:preprotein translocase SecF subunit
MFRIITETNYKFMSYRRYATVFSGFLLLVGVAAFIIHGGFNLGIDFEGGLLIEFGFNEIVPIDEVRQAVANLGYEGAEIQDVAGNPRDLMIRVPLEGDRAAAEASPSAKILAELQKSYPNLEGDLRLEESVGPKIGQELRGKATMAVLIALVLILGYITVRFQLKFALAAVLALFHDVLVVLALFALLQREITLPVIAALLTIGGYSVNDTIVVFDRIREQLKIRRKDSLEDIINLSVNQTLSRTIITSVTTLFAVLALFILGGQVIHDFSLAMLAGVLIGTYSSIFVASSTVLQISQLTGRTRKRSLSGRARASTSKA